MNNRNAKDLLNLLTSLKEEVIDLKHAKSTELAYDDAKDIASTLTYLVKDSDFFAFLKTNIRLDEEILNHYRADDTKHNEIVLRQFRWRTEEDLLKMIDKVQDHILHKPSFGGND